MRELARLFKLDYGGLNAILALLVLELILLDFVVLVTNRNALYLLSAIFGTLFVGISDPGNGFAARAKSMAFVGILGALLTAFGFSLGTAGWGWVALAGFGVTLLGGLSLRLGIHRFVASYLLNLWFVVALGLGSGFSQSHASPNAWGQALAWLGGGALWFVVALLLWLIRGRTAKPIITQMPTENTPRHLTKPLVAFAVARALALAVALAIPFGLDLAHGYWLPIATLVSMKADLSQATFFSVQRLIGTLVGAGLALVLLGTISNKLQLVVIALILLANGAAIRFVNYALYCAAIASGVLVALDVFHPTNRAAEWDRVWYTLGGLGIGIAVMLLAGLLGKRRANAPPPQKPR